MKTKACMVALVVLMSATAFASGSGPRIAVVGQQKAGMFKVIYEGEKVGNVKLSIYNVDGVNVFTQITNNVSGFIQPVNFKQMEPGEYTIEVSDATGTKSQKISYSSTKLVKNAHVSKLAAEGKYLLALPNDGTKNITVSIFDGDRNLVHVENRTINGNLGLVYSLKDVSGVPTFVITEKE